MSPHFRLIGDDEVGFAREWGMRTEIEDLRRVVRRASARGGKVVLGGNAFLKALIPFLERTAR